MLLLDTKRITFLVAFIKAVLVSIFILSWRESSQYKYCGYKAGDTITCSGNENSPCSRPPDCGTFHDTFSPYTCTPSASAQCLCHSWFKAFFVIMLCYSVCACVEWFMSWRYGKDFDPHMLMVGIAESHELSAASMTVLLHPSLCLLSLLEIGAIMLVPSAMVHRDVYCSSHPESEQNILILFLCLMVALSPNVIAAIELWQQSRWHDGAKIFLRLDISLIYSLYTVMQAAVFPLSILSYVSSSRADVRASDAFVVDGPLAIENPENGYREDGAASADCAKLSLIAVDRDWQNGWNEVFLDLFRRPTAVYSFVKMMMCILLSAGLDHDFSHCGQDRYDWKASCRGESIDRCYSMCLSDQCIKDARFVNQTCVSRMCEWRNFEYFTDDYMYCTASITAGGLCDNWMILKFSVIAMNVLHFAIQCAYYFKYENFDPQQNQIQIIQRYLFTGENLTHFLLHPAMCLISVLEAGSVMVAWLGVFFPPGIYCDIGQKSDTVYNAVVFAVMITAFEVYKANISSALRCFGEKKYSAMMLSFFRLDLFVFFGLTLFLQVFLFPLSLYSHILGKWNEKRKKSKTMSEKVGGSSWSVVAQDDGGRDEVDVTEPLFAVNENVGSR